MTSLKIRYTIWGSNKHFVYFKMAATNITYINGLLLYMNKCQEQFYLVFKISYQKQ